MSSSKVNEFTQAGAGPGFSGIPLLWDGVSHGWLSFIQSVMQIIFFLFFSLAALAGFYAYTHPIDYSNATDCPRLVMYALVTAITLTIWLGMSIISWFVKNDSWKTMHYWLFVVGFGLFFFIFNIFASVWIWSTPGKYYNEQGCSVLIVKNVKLYLALYWAIYAFSTVLGCLVACGVVSVKSNTPAEAHDYQAVRTNA